MQFSRTTVADYVSMALTAYQVPVVFELTGGMITFLLDAMHRAGAPSMVSMHHEQAAAFAAEGWARMTGLPGVALATSGPGATNLLTGIGSCFFDSVPAVFITGQVNTHESGSLMGVRQGGFQETEIVAIAGPITKAAWRVNDAEELPAVLRRAFDAASSGRPGPVLVDIPMDVQRAECSYSETDLIVQHPLHPAIDRGEIRVALERLAEGERPLILAGGGVRTARATELLERFVESTGLPVVTSLMGRDALSDMNPHRFGMIGTYGNRWANTALGRSDAVLVLGSRLDVRQTGSDPEAFHGSRTVIQIDADANELAARFAPDVAIHGDIHSFLEGALSTDVSWPDLAAWRAELEALESSMPDSGEPVCEGGIHPADLMHELSRRFEAASAFVIDVGQHQMWAAQSLRLAEGQRFLTSGGMGAMGFALPAAIGATYASAGRTVVAIMGDGGAQVNLQELEVVARLGLPVKVVIIDNGGLGMVRQFQDELFEGRYQSTVIGYGSPDFVGVARAFGLDAARVDTAEQLQPALNRLCKDMATPGCLVVGVSAQSKVCPKVQYGRPVFDMDEPSNTGGSS